MAQSGPRNLRGAKARRLCRRARVDPSSHAPGPIRLKVQARRQKPLKLQMSRAVFRKRWMGGLCRLLTVASLSTELHLASSRNTRKNNPN